MAVVQEIDKVRAIHRRRKVGWQEEGIIRIQRRERRRAYLFSTLRLHYNRPTTMETVEEQRQDIGCV
jgi:hypothetical protein